MADYSFQLSSLSSSLLSLPPPDKVRAEPFEFSRVLYGTLRARRRNDFSGYCKNLWPQGGEVPLVATRFQYRRLGMCRVLMNELEKKLMESGVERLVLPAVPSVLNTWTTSFGFSVMKKLEILDFLDYTFLDFQGTFMCQKLLKGTSQESSLLRGTQLKLCDSANGNDGSSAVSEVLQVERIEESENLDQGSSEYVSCLISSILADLMNIIIII